MGIAKFTPEEIVEIEGYIQRECIRDDVAKANFSCLYIAGVRCDDRLACKNCMVCTNEHKSYDFMNLNGTVFIMRRSPLD